MISDAHLGKSLVAAQFGLLAALLWVCPLVAPIKAGLWPVVLVQFAAVAWGAWAAVTMLRVQRKMFNIQPDPRGHQHLVIHGPYRWVRHPMYTSLLVFFGALAASSLQILAAALWFALLAVLLIKARHEEGLLRQQFADYDAYAQQTPRLLPGLF